MKIARQETRVRTPAADHFHGNNIFTGARAALIAPKSADEKHETGKTTCYQVWITISFVTSAEISASSTEVSGT